MRLLLSIFATLPLLAPALLWADPDPRIAFDHAFPDADADTYYAGELILVEHVNRRGILRLDRDGMINKYHWDLPHEFQMLPYASITYRGAVTELRDVPLGTHLHGLFYLGPEGDYEVKPPVSGYAAGNMTKPDLRSVVSQFSRVLRLEDDFSYFLRHGVGWKIAALGEDETLTAELVHLENGESATELGETVGMAGEQVFHLDQGCRVWQGRVIASLADLAEGQVVQMNLGRVSLLGSHKRDGLCREIWIDQESWNVATEQQRQLQIAYQKRRGVSAMVMKTESMPGEGARGHMTVQLHAGLDPELIEAIKEAKSVAVWAVEPSLRGYENDSKPASELKIREIDNPAPGSSGVEIRMHLYELLEGFRAGRTVRIAPRDWVVPERPLEERLWPRDTRKFDVGPPSAAGRD